MLLALKASSDGDMIHTDYFPDNLTTQMSYHSEPRSGSKHSEVLPCYPSPATLETSLVISYTSPPTAAYEADASCGQAQVMLWRHLQAVPWASDMRGWPVTAADIVCTPLKPCGLVSLHFLPAGPAEGLCVRLCPPSAADSSRAAAQCLCRGVDRIVAVLGFARLGTVVIQVTVRQPDCWECLGEEALPLGIVSAVLRCFLWNFAAEPVSRAVVRM